MLKHLKLFEKHSQYEEYVGGGEMILPNVSYCKDQTDIVHYNPTDITVEGKFTVPSRFYDTVINNGGGMVIDPGGGAIAERSVGGTTRSLAKSATISSSSVYTGGTCYGLDSGLRMVTEQAIEYDNHTPILNAQVVTLQTGIIDSENEYSFVIITGFPVLSIDDTTEEVIDNGYETSDGIDYYYTDKFPGISGRMDSEGNFECGKYHQDKNDAWVFETGQLPKMSVKEMNYIDSNGNPVTADINCIHLKQVENGKQTTVEYNGTITIGQPQTTYYNSLLPISGASQQGGLGPIGPIEGPILAAVRNVNDNEPSVHDLFKAIKVDDEEIDIDELVENEGWYQFDTGVHTIVYVLNTATNNAIYKGFLMPGLFSGIAIEEVQLDERIKGSYMSRETQSSQWGHETVVLSTPFDNCALIGTDEETINKICTIKQLELSEENGLPLRTRKIKPLVLECEFEDEDDIIYGNNSSSGGRLSNQTYFAVCNEKAGMHVCTSSGSGGGGGGEAK